MEVLPCQFQNPERRGIFFIKKGGVAAGFLADIAIHNNIISRNEIFCSRFRPGGFPLCYNKRQKF
jgi:hypothetical protein